MSIKSITIDKAQDGTERTVIGFTSTGDVVNLVNVAAPAEKEKPTWELIQEQEEQIDDLSEIVDEAGNLLQKFIDFTNPENKVKVAEMDELLLETRKFVKVIEKMREASMDGTMPTDTDKD